MGTGATRFAFFFAVLLHQSFVHGENKFTSWFKGLGKSNSQKANSGTKNAEKAGSDIMFFKDATESLQKGELIEGKTFNYALSMDTSTTPFTMGIYVKGNGVEDELHVNVNDVEEASYLVVENEEAQITFIFVNHEYVAVSTLKEPGVLRVSNHKECTKRTYDNKNQKTVTPIKEKECKEFLKVAESDIMFFKDKNKNPLLQKNELIEGATYNYAFSMDTSTTPFTLGIYVKGNGVEDELHVKVDTVEEVQEVVVDNQEAYITFIFESREFMAVSTAEEPSKLTVIDHGKCTHRMYDETNQKCKPAQFPVEQEECDDIIQIVSGPEETQVLYDYSDEDVKKLYSNYGDYFSDAVVVTREEPYVLGLYITGPGIIDELHVTVDDMEDVRLVRVKNEGNRLILSLPEYEISAIGKAEERGSLVVIVGDVCTKRIYDAKTPRLIPTPEEVDPVECEKFIQEVQDADPPIRPMETVFTFHQDYSREYEGEEFLIKWDKTIRGLFSHGFVLDKSTDPYTLGMFVVGNRIQDEFHFAVNDEEEARQAIAINERDRLIFNLPSQGFSAISKLSTKGESIEVWDRKVCRKRIYDKVNVRLEPTIAEVDSATCADIIKEIDLALSKLKEKETNKNTNKNAEEVKDEVKKGVEEKVKKENSEKGKKTKQQLKDEQAKKGKKPKQKTGEVKDFRSKLSFPKLTSSPKRTASTKGTASPKRTASIKRTASTKGTASPKRTASTKGTASTKRTASIKRTASLKRTNSKKEETDSQ